MINPNSVLSRTRQCQLLNIHRSSTYYRAKPISDDDQAMMRKIDKLHLDKPFLGSRRLTDTLKEGGDRIGRNRVIRLMQLMGIQAVYPKPRTTKRNPDHKVYPYLLRNMSINQPNQVWATDITYIPMDKGFSYLTVIMDWHSRKVLSWRLSNSMDVSFCIDALEEAIHHYGCPDIFNSDQGSQYTSGEFTQVLKHHQIRISMDGKGAWRDNVFVERLWRSVKYEDVYLNAYESMTHARSSLGKWVNYYNQQRKHQTLKATPDQVYYETIMPLIAA